MLEKPVRQTAAVVAKLPGVPRMAGDAVMKGLDALASYWSNVVDRVMQRDLELLAYTASKSHFVWQVSNTGEFTRIRDDSPYERAGVAVALRYNSHDWRLPVPTGAMIDAYNAMRAFPFRKMSDSVFESVIKQVVDPK